MHLHLLFCLLLAACAGPTLHRAPRAFEAEAVRPPVATTLAPADPLAASNCDLPIARSEACAKPASAPAAHPEGTP